MAVRHKLMGAQGRRPLHSEGGKPCVGEPDERAVSLCNSACGVKALRISVLFAGKIGGMLVTGGVQVARTVAL